MKEGRSALYEKNFKCFESHDEGMQGRNTQQGFCDLRKSSKEESSGGKLRWEGRTETQSIYTTNNGNALFSGNCESRRRETPTTVQRAANGTT